MSSTKARLSQFDPAMLERLRASRDLSLRDSAGGATGAPTQFKVFSVSGMSVFDAVQARALGKMDVDGDGGLTAAELSTGVPRIDDRPAAGELALRRLLQGSLDRLSEAFKSRLERQSIATSA